MDTAELEQSTRQVLGPGIGRLRPLAIGMVVAGLIGCGITIGMESNVTSFFQSYLFAYMFWFGISAGSFGLLMLHHTVGGGWGFVIRRFLEAAVKLFPLLLILFIPIALTAWRPEWQALFADPELTLPGAGAYGWASAKAATDPIIQFKSALLNPLSFTVLSVAFFLFWMGWSAIVLKLSDMQNYRVDPKIDTKLAKWGGSGILVHSLVVTMVSVLWVMSLTPHWYSSIFGLLFLASQALSTLALMVILVSFLAGDTGLVRGVARPYFRDLGNLTLATVMLWAYMSFSQYLIQYSGNTHEEVPWFIAHKQGGWTYVGTLLIVCHFALPFFWLLIGSNFKRRANSLAYPMAFIILMRFVEQWWMIAPNFRPTAITPHAIAADLGAPLLLGGIWLLAWSGAVMTEKSVVPMYDPRVQDNLQEVLSHG